MDVTKTLNNEAPFSFLIDFSWCIFGWKGVWYSFITKINVISEIPVGVGWKIFQLNFVVVETLEYKTNFLLTTSNAFTYTEDGRWLEFETYSLHPSFDGVLGNKRQGKKLINFNFIPPSVRSWNNLELDEMMKSFFSYSLLFYGKIINRVQFKGGWEKVQS